LSTRKKWFVLYLERVSRRREVEALGERTVHGAPRTAHRRSLLRSRRRERRAEEAHEVQDIQTEIEQFRHVGCSFGSSVIVQGDVEIAEVRLKDPGEQSVARVRRERKRERERVTPPDDRTSSNQARATWGTSETRSESERVGACEERGHVVAVPTGDSRVRSIGPPRSLRLPPRRARRRADRQSKASR